jgi:type III secretory pathway component EscT
VVKLLIFSILIVLFNLIFPPNLEGKEVLYINQPSVIVNYTITTKEIILGINIGGPLTYARVYQKIN